jgi:ankyrin repeat protein
MKKILKKKSRSRVDEYGRNDLHYAALKNDLAHARQLIASGIDVNALDGEGFSPLHFAVQENHKDMVRTLLDYGATVDLKDKYGNTPLMRALDPCYAAMAMGMPDPGAIIKMLLQAGADPNSENNYGVKIIDCATDCDRDLKQFFDQQK